MSPRSRDRRPGHLPAGRHTTAALPSVPAIIEHYLAMALRPALELLMRPRGGRPVVRHRGAAVHGCPITARAAALRCPEDGQIVWAWAASSLMEQCEADCPQEQHYHVTATCGHVYTVAFDWRVYPPMRDAS